MAFPANLKYTHEHEWVRVEGNEAFVGITEFAQHELGDIVYVEVETVGNTFAKGDVFGSVEAVKTVAELFIPITGTIIEFNTELADSPELVNEDPYGKGWMVRMTIADSAELDGLLSPSAYETLVNG